MSLPGRPRGSEAPADAGSALEVVGLSRYFSHSAVLYAPVESIFSRYRRNDRAIGVDSGIGDDEDGDDGGDDDDLDEDEENLQPIVEEDRVGGVWALRDISFALPAGRSLGVIGPRGAGRTTLIRVLGRIIPPTSGRIVMRGRVGPAVGFTSTFVRVDLDVAQNAKMLSSLLHVPRAQRAAYVEHLCTLVLGSGRTKLPGSLDTRQITRRIAVAAALDPGCDVVLLDELGLAGDVNFHERVLERLELLRRQGTSIVLATQDISLVRRFCDDALALEDGRLTGFGPAEEVILDHRRRRTLASATQPPQSRPTLQSFSAAAAVLDVDTATSDGVPASTFGAGDVVVRIELETASPGTFVLLSVLLRQGGSGVTLREGDPSLLPEAGRYLVSVQVPGEALAPGRYAVDVEAEVDHDGGRSVIGRRGVRSFEIPGVPASVSGGGDDPEPDGVLETVPVAAEWNIEPLQ